MRLMNSIRAFIAIPLPPAVITHLSQISQALGRQTPPGAIRWVQPEAMHLTLVFLGDTAEDKLPAVYQALDQVAAGHAPFAMRLGELGCFPNTRRPRVVWVGFQNEVEKAQALKKALDEALLPLGWPPETRPFQPHLTLGRVKDVAQSGRLRYGQPVEPLVVPVAELRLYESQLRPAGPVYTVRHTSPLQF